MLPSRRIHRSWLLWLALGSRWEGDADVSVGDDVACRLLKFTRAFERSEARLAAECAHCTGTGKDQNVVALVQNRGTLGSSVDVREPSVRQDRVAAVVIVIEAILVVVIPTIARGSPALSGGSKSI